MDRNAKRIICRTNIKGCNVDYINNNAKEENVKKKKSYLVFVLVLICLAFAGMGTALAAGPSPEDREELYRKVEELREDGEYDAAYTIVKKLIDENSESNKYQIAYIDVILEQSRIMKDMNNPGWKLKAKEAGGKIKALYSVNTSNADYFLVYAKYSWIVEARREKHITGALEKAFHFKPNYVNNHIVKGDIYFGLAKSSSALEQQPADTTSLTGGESVQTKHMLAMTAKSAYNSALATPDINNKKKAYVLLKLGDLQDQILGDKTEARRAWEKAVALSPGNSIGKAASERLKK